MFREKKKNTLTWRKQPNFFTQNFLEQLNPSVCAQIQGSVTLRNMLSALFLIHKLTDTDDVVVMMMKPAYVMGFSDIFHFSTQFWLFKANMWKYKLI